MQEVPIYIIEIPSYEVDKIDILSGEKYFTEYGTAIPIEYWNKKPSFSEISQPIVQFLRKHHLGEKVGIRLISSKEHPEKTLGELIEIIKKIGHDRYDDKRKGDRYENVEHEKIDLFMLEIEIGKENGEDSEEQMQHAFASFYLYPFKHGKHPNKIDLGIIYDLKAFESVVHNYSNKERESKTDGYIFKSSDNRSEAIKGILILK